MSRPVIEVLRDETADPTLALPSYESAGAAGADIRVCLASSDRAEGLTLMPGTRALVPTGLRIAIPEGFELQIRPRSGLALKHGITLLNTPGTIDSDYRGPLGLIVINLSDTPYVIAHGDRMAQMVLAPVVQADFAEVSQLSATHRGAGGFGSTGTG